MAIKNYNLFLYGPPGTGKSTFAAGASRPFFICTDKNYDWLGLPDKDHVQVTNWTECVEAFSESYDDYDTIVIDLIEDCFRMCEEDYCKRNKIEYVGNKGYGEGWRVTRDSFLLALGRLDNLVGKNIIIISHQTSYTFKDKRGVETTTYTPSKRLPDDVMDQIEGRFRFVLRCYMTDELVNNKFVKRRYLSLIPKPEESYGIARGIDESSLPSDITLDYATFAEVLGIEQPKKEEPDTEKVEEKPEEPQRRRRSRSKPEPEPEPEPKPEPETEKVEEKVEEKTEPEQEQHVAPEEKPVEAKAEAQPQEEKQEQATESKAEKLARLRAKYGI